MQENEKFAEEVEQTPEAVEETQQAVAEETAPVAEEVIEEVPVAEETAPAADEVIEEAPAAKKETPKYVKPTGPVTDFDWDSYEKGDVMTGKSKDELEKIYDDTLNAIKDKEVVEGTVTSINKREVVVNVGFKSDGVVSMSEFRYNPELKVGDKVEVYIESQEDKKGQLILSIRRTQQASAWLSLENAKKNNEVVEAVVVESNTPLIEA